MNMPWIDTHAHLSSEAVYPHITEVLERAKSKGLEKIVNICTDAPSLQKGLELRKLYPWVFNTAATTPHDVEKEGASFFPLVEEQALAKQLVAIGETGLDYHYEHSPRDLQKEFLLRYFDLAKRAGLPLIFHCRDAFEDLFSLADIHYSGLPAVLHCFTGSLEEAKGVLDRGWYLSLSGIVTFKKSIELKETAKFVPVDRLFIETDTPYLAPQNHRGKPNEPSFLPEIAAAIAEIKGISQEELSVETRKNAEKFFSF